MNQVRDYSVSEVLKHGTCVTIRAIRPEDRKLVVTTETDRGETIIATGRYIASDARNTHRSAELAFVVEEDYQGRGIASRLLTHLAALARSQGLTHFEADVLSQNNSMLAVFRRCGFPMQQRRDGSVVHLTLELVANDSAAG